MSRRSTIRASDDDRERVAERLRQAAIEGRILAHELEERLGRTFRARTYGDLDEVVSDLPDGRAGVQRSGSRGGVTLLLHRSPLLIVAVVAVALVAVLVAAAVFVALWGGWLVIIGLLTLLARRRAYGGRYGGRFRI
jgi:Flp pilus assembly protein TadB